MTEEKLSDLWVNAVDGDEAAEIDLQSGIGNFLKMKIPRFSLKSQNWELFELIFFYQKSMIIFLV